MDRGVFAVFASVRQVEDILVYALQVFGVDARSGRWKLVLCVANVEALEGKRCLGLGEGG
jgi:hypothetical protein